MITMLLAKRILLAVAMLVAAAALVYPFAPAAKADGEAKAHKTDWLYKAKWGVMFHYTDPWQGAGTIEEWNKRLDGFDVDGLAKQLKELGAGYLMITSKHGGKFTLAPNAAFEKANPGCTPKRDLIGDLAEALDKQGIGLMLYYATGMGIDKPKVANVTAEVIGEWSKKYGKKVRGWWLDNNVGDQDLQKLIADAARSGNPDTVVGFSPPKAPSPRRNSPQDDYTAGNTHAPGPARCSGRFVDGAQWHILTYLGNNWAGVHKKAGMRFSPERAAGMTAGALSKGGVVTWDVKPLASGLIDPAYLPGLKAIGEAAAKIQR
ncbi:MAG: alpha-L-fucosidase [Planctomycetaceae bacterium]|nr:alpha-L-fucosidase [Planctomycetaceae bacterium]